MNVETVEICVCGHPVLRHELRGTEYARCRMFMAGPLCECEMRSKPVLIVDKSKQPYFKRTTRGSEYPHALNGAVEKAGLDAVEWLVTHCDNCGSEVTDGSLKAMALDESRTPMPHVKPYTRLDTGHHILVCVDCWDTLQSKEK